MNIETIKSKVKRNGVYFQIIYKIDGEKYTYSNISEKNAGLKVFNAQMKDVENMSPDVIVVELFSFANTKMRLKPDETIVYKDSERKSQKQEFRGFGELGQFGGIENYINTAVTAKAAVKTTENLEKENTKLTSKVENQEQLIDKLRAENWTLFQQTKMLEFSLLNEQKDKQSEINRIKSQNNNLQNYLPAIGTIAARLMGLNGEQMRGLFGITEEDFQPQIPENTNQSAVENTEAENKFEFKESENKEHSQVKEIKKLLDELSKAEQMDILNKIYSVFSYISKSRTNLDTLVSLIN